MIRIDPEIERLNAERLPLKANVQARTWDNQSWRPAVLRARTQAVSGHAEIHYDVEFADRTVVPNLASAMVRPAQ
jgi:hypothetical protein